MMWLSTMEKKEEDMKLLMSILEVDGSKRVSLFDGTTAAVMVIRAVSVQTV